MVASYEKAAVSDDSVNFAAGVAAGVGALIVLLGVVRMETVRVLVVIHGQNTIVDRHTFAGKGNDSFDDEFFGSTDAVAGVLKDDNLAAFGYVRFVLELRPGDGEAINNEPVARMKRVFHAWPQDVKGAKDKRIDDERANEDTGDKDGDAQNIFQKRVALEK